MDNFLENIKSGNGLHHFYILEGDQKETSQALISFLENELGYSTRTNPLFLNINFDKLLIEDAKEIGRKSILKTPEGQKMIFLVSYNSATLEAQNSLLKIVEEPPYETYFFFNVPRADIFLPTVTSRAIVIKGGNRKKRSLLTELESMSVSERVRWAEDLAKKVSDEKISRGEISKIVDDLILEIHSQLSTNPEYSETLKILQKVSRYLSLNGSSLKILLGRVALAI